MVARSQKKIIKAHALRKRVKLENKRLRARNKAKKKDVAYTIKPGVRHHLKLSPEVREKLLAYCSKTGKKPWNVIRVALNQAMNKDEQAVKEYIKD